MPDESNDVLSLLSTLLVKNYPKAWQKLWENIHSLSQKSRISVNASLEVYKLVYDCVSKEEEGRPVSTGFLVGDSEQFRERLPDSAGIELERKNISNEAESIRRLFGLIDGCASTFIVGRDGTLECTRLFPWTQGLSDEVNLASYDFSVHCSILKDVSGYGLVALGPFKTAKLFSKGLLSTEVYFSGKTGGWTYRSLSEVMEKLDQMAVKKGIDRRLLNKILSYAVNMSNHRKGGTFIIGDHEAIFKQAETPRLILNGSKLLDLKGLQERHLYNLATQEFALVVSREGELRGSSVRLLAKVPENVKVEVTATDGGRHRSAAEISASTNSVAFVVSVDGPITIYEEGKRIARV